MVDTKSEERIAWMFSESEEEFYLTLNDMIVSDDLMRSTYGRTVRNLMPVVRETVVDSFMKAVEKGAISKEEAKHSMWYIVHGITTGFTDTAMNCIVGALKEDGEVKDLLPILSMIARAIMHMSSYAGASPILYTYSIRDTNGVDTGPWSNRWMYLNIEDAERAMKKEILETLGDGVSYRMSESGNEGEGTKEIAYSVYGEGNKLLADCLVYPVKVTI